MNQMEQFRDEWNKLSIKQLTIESPRQYENDPHYLWGGDYARRIIVSDTRDGDFILFANKWMLQIAVALIEANEVIAEKDAELLKAKENLTHFKNTSDAYYREFTKYQKIVEEILAAKGNDMFALQAVQHKILEMKGNAS